jgi:uncharacterized DUF497 family protein
MPYLFEWDPKKAAGNARTYGVTFEEGTEVFGDPLQSTCWTRIINVMRSDSSSLAFRAGAGLVVSYAERGPRTRLIVARLASRAERRRYEEELP